jgi:long-chain acyl-CoA synthetase
MDPFSRWPNLPAMMLGLGAERGDAPMVRYHRGEAWRQMGWGEFARQAASLAAALRPHLAAREAVLLVSESRPEVLIANVALQAIGVMPVPAYVTNAAADHAHLLRDSGARVAIVSTVALARTVLAGAAQAAGLDALICMEAFTSADCRVLGWSELTGNDGALAEIRALADRIRAEDVAVLMYTSGTGGTPKGVKIPHRAILSNCAGAAEIVAPLRLAGEVYLSILPLSHTYEYTVGQFILPVLNCEVVFGRGVEHLASDMATIRPHIMTVVPRVLDVIRGRVLGEVERGPAWRARLFRVALGVAERRLDGATTLLDRLIWPALDRLVCARVRARFGGRMIAMVSGGARLDPVVGRFYLAMGLRVLQGYGQTEAGPVISVNPLHDIRIDTVGPPLRGVEVRIAEDGEILVRGPLVMLGYWNLPGETARTLEDGWLHTGDIGRLDGGYLKITDRKKDIIVLSGGETISPARIEGLLMAEPEIAQAVVLGEGATGLSALLVPAEGCGEAVVAAAVKRVNARLSGAEKLRRHAMVEAFTLENGLLTPSYKIRRQSVIDRHVRAVA